MRTNDRRTAARRSSLLVALVLASACTSEMMEEPPPACVEDGDCDGQACVDGFCTDVECLGDEACAEGFECSDAHVCVEAGGGPGGSCEGCAAPYVCDEATDTCTFACVVDGRCEDCDALGDEDRDGVPACVDECPMDGDKAAPGTCGCGTADVDTDGDLTLDCNDRCPEDPAKAAPGVCGCGTADADADGDGTPDCDDRCPGDAAKTAPGGCGCGVADADTDGDGTLDCDEACPDNPDKETAGACGCDTPDTDSDGDGTPDCIDECPMDADKVLGGTCGCGVAEADSDGDGTLDCEDGCPMDITKTAPGTCGCGVADDDGDGDGVLDCEDECPGDPDKTAAGTCGCGVADADRDGNGTLDCLELCPSDPDKETAGVCGCGVPDTDSDGDGTPDCIDECPMDGGKTAPGTCGCGTPDTDADGDGTPSCADDCPTDGDKTAPGACGCGVADEDTDGDGTAECVDNCPGTANASQADADGDGVGDACDLCNDVDGDGYGDGTNANAACDASADDCAPMDGTRFRELAGYADVDGDGVGAGSAIVACVGATDPDDVVTTNTDCAPTDPRHWADCGACVDGDDDGRGTSCDLGGDCRDDDVFVWGDCDLSCTDADGDRHGVGCDLGPDCDDTNPAVHASMIEIPEDGVDNDCAGGDGALNDTDYVFVSEDGDDANPGTAARPVADLPRAVEIASASTPAKTVVLADFGLYTGTTVTVSVLGGFTHDCERDGRSCRTDADGRPILTPWTYSGDPAYIQYDDPDSSAHRVHFDGSGGRIFVDRVGTSPTNRSEGARFGGDVWVSRSTFYDERGSHPTAASVFDGAPVFVDCELRCFDTTFGVCTALWVRTGAAAYVGGSTLNAQSSGGYGLHVDAVGSLTSYARVDGSTVIGSPAFQLGELSGADQDAQLRASDTTFQTNPTAGLSFRTGAVVGTNGTLEMHRSTLEVGDAGTTARGLDLRSGEAFLFESTIEVGDGGTGGVARTVGIQVGQGTSAAAVQLVNGAVFTGAALTSVALDVNAGQAFLFNTVLDGGTGDRSIGARVRGAELQAVHSVILGGGVGPSCGSACTDGTTAVEIDGAADVLLIDDILRSGYGASTSYAIDAAGVTSAASIVVRHDLVDLTRGALTTIRCPLYGYDISLGGNRCYPNIPMMESGDWRGRVSGGTPPRDPTGNLIGTPGFVDEAGRDFRIVAADSSADENGEDPTAYYGSLDGQTHADTDIDGTARPLGSEWDIGLHEAR